jgi:hypothetical protein
VPTNDRTGESLPVAGRVKLQAQVKEVKRVRATLLDQEDRGSGSFRTCSLWSKWSKWEEEQEKSESEEVDGSSHCNTVLFCAACAFFFGSCFASPRFFSVSSFQFLFILVWLFSLLRKRSVCACVRVSVNSLRMLI